MATGATPEAAQQAEVVTVVVDPFVEEVADVEPANRRVHPATLQVGGGQALDQCHAVLAHGVELGQQLGGGALAVVALACGRFLVRFHERQVGRVEHAADATVEPAAVGLDDVADAFHSAPFARGRVPGQHVVRQVF
ncbi:MAG TPA: hypothetical protein VKV73_04985 [Chloroflexota bacterium]|nr:hypothetical protein [Chloroflexota bacterium]